MYGDVVDEVPPVDDESGMAGGVEEDDDWDLGHMFSLKDGECARVFA